MPEEFEALAIDWWHGRVSAVQAGRALGVSRATFQRRAEEWSQNQGLAKRGRSRAPYL